MTGGAIWDRISTGSGVQTAYKRRMDRVREVTSSGLQTGTSLGLQTGTFLGLQTGTSLGLQTVASGGTVVTSNQRAARELRRAFDRQQREAGNGIWEPAEVLSWESWTASLWRGLLLDGHARAMLLNRSQELAVWRAVIADDAPGANEAVREQMAELAVEAWRALLAYGDLAMLQRYDANTDVAAFARWARAFERRCRSEGYRTRAGIEEALLPEVETGRIRRPRGRLELIGFDELVPARRRLMDAMVRAGVEVVESAPETRSARVTVATAANGAEELQCCAMWVRRQMEARPEMRIGVIVPGLGGRREEIDRIFRRVLAPELESLVAPADGGSPYEFSLGVSLTSTPAGWSAVRLLRWAAGALPIEEASRLLLSPYLGGEGGGAERQRRAIFDASDLRRREMLRPEITAGEMLRAARGTSRQPGGLPRLVEVLGAFAAVAKRCGEEAREEYDAWAEVMRELLGAVRWSEGGGTGSLALQTVRAWEGVLDEMATMDFAGQAVSYAEALAEAERMAKETIFAPESRDAPVQVLGPMEAAGSGFDAVWVLGAHETAWPPRTGLQPLLPWAMQRDLRMPGADVATDAERGRGLTERITASAAVTIFSYAREGTEGRQRVSAAAQAASTETVEATVLAGPATVTERTTLERVEDADPIRLPPDEVIRGGASVLEAQAACGFQAFAKVRLSGRAPEAKELGWDVKVRGILLHKVLEAFWGEVKAQHVLLAMSPKEREESIGRAISVAMEGRGEDQQKGLWDAAYVAVQRERMRRLMRDWLTLEATRSPFAVRVTEDDLTDMRVGPLRLSVRVDRVDETELGDVLIDYKTGEAKTTGWEGDRPDAPQLPLYAILSEAERVEGVAFGSVRAGKGMGLEGYAEHRGSLPKVVQHGMSDFAEQVEAWRGVLTGLAEAFYRGDARVDPKSYPRTCKYCQARLLCRLDAEALSVADEEEEDEEAELV